MRKIMKLIIPFIFVICLSLILSACGNDNSLNNNFEFKLLADGTFSVSNKSSIETRKIIIPNEYNGKKVTVVEDYGFDLLYELEEVVIPNNVTYIGENAFFCCKNLKKVRISSNIKKIGENAFGLCDKLQYNIFNDSGYLGNEDNPYLVLMDTECTKCVINVNTKIIYGDAFAKCERLSKLIIPNSVISIGDGINFNNLFYLNYNSYNNGRYLGNEDNPYLVFVSMEIDDLFECEINENTKFICQYAFMYSSLKSIEIPSGVISIGCKAFYNCRDLTNVIIPDSVTSIGKSAFENCTKLANINLPSNLTTIGDYSFSFCSSLVSIEIPSSVANIGKNVFYCCSNLVSIVVNKNNRIYDSRNDCNAVICTSLDTLIIGISSTKIPNSVKIIGDSAFEGCSQLTSIEIPSSVTKIGDKAFFSCKNLTNITIPSSISSTGKSSFSFCESLKFNEYDNAYYLGNEENPYLLLVRTKEKITTCNINENTKIICESAFSQNDIVSIEIPSNVKSIGDSAFFLCDELTNIKLSSGLINIEDKAFRCCYKLTSIEIPSSVTKIEGNILLDCQNLTSIIVDSKNKVYDSRNNCNAIIETSTNTLMAGCLSTKIPNNVTCIGDSAFLGFSSLTSIEIPSSVTYIGKSAFSGCNSLKSIKIPSSVTSISAYLFFGCRSLNNIIYGGTIEQWNNIQKNENWDYETPTYVIHCSDGDINK